jgi:O-antigen ligase
MRAALGRTLSYLSIPSVGGIRSVSIWLSLVFVFSVPWENAIQIGHIGRASKVLGYLTVLVWGLGVLAHKRLRKPDSLQKAFLLFLIWNGLTLYWSLDQASTLSAFVTYTEMFGLLLLFWDLYDREVLVKAALQAYVLGAFVAAGSIIVNYLMAPPARFPEHERISALGYKTDGIALIVAVAAPAAWYLAAGPGARERPASARALNYAYISVAVVAVAMTGTRGATVASIPTAFFIIWSLRSASVGKRVAALTAAALAGVALIQFAPTGQLDRIATAGDLGEQTPQGALGGRVAIWRDSAHVFIQHPIAGVGTDSHRAAVAPLLEQRSAYKKAEKEAHNTYVSVLVETGLVGFALFAFIIMSLIRRVRERAGWDRWYWTAQMSVLALGAMTLSLEDSKSLWIMTSLAVASAAAAKTHEARAPDRSRAAQRVGTVLRPSPRLRFD